MVAWMAGLVLGLAPVPQDAERLRTLLPNGSIVAVERRPGQTGASVQLWVSLQRPVASSIPPLEAVHLLEHLLLTAEADVDRRLEANGMASNGLTYRDALQLRISCGASQVADAVQEMAKLMKRPSLDPAALERERRLVLLEIASRSDDERLSAAAWELAFQGQVGDPVGRPEVVSSLTEADVLAAYDSHVRARNLVLLIVGDVDLDAATELGRQVLEGFDKGDRVAPRERPESVGGRASVPGAIGDGRACVVPEYDNPATAARLAAALAVASQVPSSFVTYTPSTLSGLIIVGQTQSTSGVGLFVDQVDDSLAAGLFPLGRALGLRWVQRQLAETDKGGARGLLMSAGATRRPEELQEALLRMTWPEFREGLAAFRGEGAITVVGEP